MTRRQPSRRPRSRSLAPGRTGRASACHTAPPSARRGRNRTKLAPEGQTSTGSSRSRGHQPSPLLDQVGHPGVHLVDVVEGQRAGQLLGRVEVIRQHHLLELGHHLGRPDQVAEAGRGHRPRLGEGAGDHQRHRRRRPGPPPTRARTARRPRPPRAGRRPTRPGRGLATHRGLVVHHARGVVGRAQEGHRWTVPGEDPAHLVEVGGQVGPALAFDHRRARQPGDVGVQGVGRAPHRRACRP